MFNAPHPLQAPVMPLPMQPTPQSLNGEVDSNYQVGGRLENHQLSGRDGHRRSEESSEDNQTRWVDSRPRITTRPKHP